MKFYSWFVFALMILTSSCQKADNKNEDTAPKSEEPGAADAMAIERSRVPVQTQPLEFRDVQNIYRASAALEAVHDVEILLAVGDTIASVNKYAGDKVEAGAVIATLDSPELQYQLQTAKVEAEEAARLHTISAELFKKKHIARDRFEETRIQQENARLALAKIRNKVGQLTIKAPFKGTVVHNDLQKDAHRSSFDTRAPIRIVDDSTLQGTFSLPLLHRSNVAVDMPITLRARALSETAVVTRVSPVVDKNTGTILVYFKIPNDTQLFFSGERVALEVPLGEASKRLVLPANSLVFEGNNPFIFVPRPPTEEEIASDLNSLVPKNEKAQNSVASTKAEDAPKDLESDEDSQAKAAKIRELIAKIPRAKKIAVAVDQLPTGEFALQASQTGEAKALTDGSKVIVIGLYQLADAAKLKVLETL